MGDPRNVKLGDLEFSVGQAYETRPSRKYVNTRPATSGERYGVREPGRDETSPRTRRSKPSR